MPLNFNKQAEKGEKFINELVSELGNNTNKSKAGRILQAVFKTLRNHLTIDENFHLIAQLPVALKPVYIDGWRPNHKQEVSRTRIGFLEEVIENKGNDSLADFPDIEDVEFGVLAVFNVMRKHVTEGEFKDIESVLPSQIKELVRDSDYYY
jgi:uncharacterized protein (DUF2267 family)